MIGCLGVRPLIEARREGAGPAACAALELRAPIDPAAAVLPLSPASGRQYGSAEWRRRTAVSFRSCRRHRGVCGAGRREGTSGCSWSGFLSRDGPLALLPPPPAPLAAASRPLRPPRAARVPEGEKKGRQGAGEAGRRTVAGCKLWPEPGAPAPRLHPSPAWATVVAGRGSGDAAGAVLAVPALSCRAWGLPT